MPVTDDRCTATYGDVKCWREAGHKPVLHHGPGGTWWQPGEVPPPPPEPTDPDGVLVDLADKVRPGMVLAAIVIRPEDRRGCGPLWLERLAIWLLERAGYEVCR